MYRQLIKILFIGIAAIPFALYAQNVADYYFINLTTQEGLSQNTVKQIMQDRQGMIWIATQTGLDKYVGKVIKPVTGFNKSLAESITYLYDWDEDHILVSTTKRNYLVNKWQFDKIKPLSGEYAKIKFISKIGDGYLVFCENSIMQVNKDLIPLWQEPKSLEYEIYQVTQYRDTYYIGTNKGLYAYSKPSEGNSPRKLPLEGDAVYSLAIDGNSGILYYGGDRNKLYRYDINSGKKNAPPLSLAGEPGRITSLLVNGKTLLVGTEKSGLSIMEVGIDTFRHLHPGNRFHSPDYFSSRVINCLFRSQDGVVWVGTEVGGLNIWPSGRLVFHTPETKCKDCPGVSMGSDVRSIYVDAVGKQILVGLKNRGIALLEEEKGKWNVTGSIQPLQLGDGGRSVYVQKQVGKELYLGTEDGIFRLKLPIAGNRGIYDRVVNSRGPVMKGETVSLLCYEAAQQRWLVGKRGGHSIRVYSRLFESYEEIKLKEVNEILSFIQPLNQVMLVGTSSGLYTYDFRNHALAPFGQYQKEVFYTCARQSGDTLWVGTDRKGLYGFNLNTGDSIFHYSKKQGLPEEAIYDIQQDRFSNFWLSTNHGLYQLQQKSSDFNHYGIGNGLNIYEYNSGATATLEGRQLFFGGINGVNYFEPAGNSPSYSDEDYILVVRCSYASWDSTNIVDFNDIKDSERRIKIPYHIGYLEIEPMLGRYKDPENNRFKVTVNGRPIDVREDGRNIIPEAWIHSNLWFWKKNEITIEYRSGNKQYELVKIEVGRRFLTGANIPILILVEVGFLGILITLFVIRRNIRNSKKLRLLQEKINEISRLDEVGDIGNTAVEHFVQVLKYDYGLISLVDFDKKMINTQFINDPKWPKEQKEEWKNLSAYSLYEDEILAQVATLGKPVVVVANKYISSDQTRKTDKLFNQQVAGKYKHNNLARVFIPIIQRGAGSLQNTGLGGEDTVLGVAEVGFRMNWLNRYFLWLGNPVLGPAYRDFNIVKYLQSQRTQLQLYIDNLSQPYYKAYLKRQRQELYEYIEQLEKESDEKGLDHNGFLAYVLERLCKRIGADYGDISLVTFNSENIDFQYKNIIYGYTHEEANRHARAQEKNRNRIGISNYVAHSKKLYYTGNVHQDDKYIELLPKAQSELAMPMRIGNTYLVGVVNLLSNTKGYFNRVIAETYQKGISRLTEIYIQKKQYVSLQKISTPFDTFSLTEEDIYKNMVEALSEYFGSDYVSTWIRKSPETNEFILSETATLPGFYRLYKQCDFTEAGINTEYKEEQSKASLVELVETMGLAHQNSRMSSFSNDNDFKNYIILKIIIDDKYQAFINVFSKRKVYEEEVTGYSKSLLHEVSKKVALASWNWRLSSSIDVVARSLIERDTENPLERIVERAYWLSPSADSVVLFPYYKGYTILMKDAIIGGRNLPWKDQNEPDKPAKFANYIINHESYYITSENQYIEVAKKAAKDRPADDTFWHKRGLKSMAAIRIEYKGEPVGVMFFNYTDQKNFSEDNTRQFIEAFVNFAKIALTSEYYIQRIQEERDKLQKDKKNIQFEYEKVYQKMEEMIPRATKASYYMIMQGINHDLRNLLIHIGSNLRKLENDNKLIQYKDRLGKNISDIKYNIGQIMNLLNLFGYQKDNKEISFNVSDIVNMVVLFFKERDEQIHINYYTERNNITLIGSKEEFSMVIYNLINNAFQAIQLKGNNAEGEITIRASIDDYKRINIWIIDDGGGIDNDIKEKIFEFGFTTKNKDGLGVGLYFVMEVITNSFNGTVEVNSQKGKGTTFHLIIPQN